MAALDSYSSRNLHVSGTNSDMSINSRSRIFLMSFGGREDGVPPMGLDGPGVVT